MVGCSSTATEKKKIDLRSSLNKSFNEDESRVSQRERDQDNIDQKNITNSNSNLTLPESDGSNSPKKIKSGRASSSMDHTQVKTKGSLKFINTVYSNNNFDCYSIGMNVKNNPNVNKAPLKQNLLFTIKENEKEEVEGKVFWMNNIVILDQEVEANPILKIKDSDDSDLLWKDTLKITAAGIENSLRHVRDGYTFFGVNESYVRFLYVMTHFRTE